MAPFGSSRRKSQANGKPQKTKHAPSNAHEDRDEQRWLAQREVLDRKLAKRKAGSMSSSGTGLKRSVATMAFGPEAAANGTPAMGGDSGAQ